MAFTMIDNIVIEDTSLTPTAKMVYTTLAKYADNITRACYPSYETIAKNVGCDRGTVIRLMKKLVDKGYVVKVKKSSDGKNAHTCNLYVLPVVEESAEKEEAKPNPKAETVTPAQANGEQTCSKETYDDQTGKLPNVYQAFPQEADRIFKNAMQNIESRNSTMQPADCTIQPPDYIMSPPSGMMQPELYSLNYTDLISFSFS